MYCVQRKTCCGLAFDWLFSATDKQFKCFWWCIRLNCPISSCVFYFTAKEADPKFHTRSFKQPSRKSSQVNNNSLVIPTKNILFSYLRTAWARNFSGQGNWTKHLMITWHLNRVKAIRKLAGREKFLPVTVAGSVCHQLDGWWGL